MSAGLFSYTGQYAAQKGGDFVVTLNFVDSVGDPVSIVGTVLFSIYRTHEGSQLLHEVAMDVSTNVATTTLSKATLEALPAGQRSYAVVNDVGALEVPVISGPFEIKQKGSGARFSGATTVAVTYGTTTVNVVTGVSISGGSGDVVGPSSVTDDRITAFSGTTGKLIKQGSVTATAVASHLSNTSNPHSVTAAQAGADPTGTAAAAVSAHAGATDPHPGYLLELSAGTADTITTVNAGGTLLSRAAYTISSLLTAAWARASHTGTQLASTISDFATAAIAAVTWSTITGKPSTFDPSAHKTSHATGGADALTAGDIGAATAAQGTDDRTASGLRTATTVVSVSAATAPSSGQTLVATSSTAATWQTPAGGMAIGAAVTGATAKRLLYVGAGPVLAEVPDWEVDSGKLHLAGASGSGGYIQSYPGGTNFGRSDAGTVTWIGIYSGSVTGMSSDGVFGWAHNNYTGDWRSPTTGLSRIDNGIVAVGNGTQGSYSGELRLTLITHAAYTVATLPSPSLCARAFVSDANSTTLGTVAAGGGANVMSVTWDLTNWRLG